MGRRAAVLMSRFPAPRPLHGASRAKGRQRRREATAPIIRPQNIAHGRPFLGPLAERLPGSCH